MYDNIRIDYINSLRKLFGFTNTLFNDKCNILTVKYKNIQFFIHINVTHSGRNLCINSGHREILYTLNEIYGDKWYFKENNYGKALLTSIENVDSDLDIDYSNFNQIYKKFFFERVDLIDKQYKNRFDSIDCYKKNKFEYNLLRIKIVTLKKDLSDTFKWHFIKKLNILDDMKKLVYNYVRFSLMEYIILRDEIEKYREKMRNLYENSHMVHTI